MKATDLAKALSEIDDAYLAELDTSEKELITMKNRKRISRILIAAAVICLLTVTAFAAEQVRVHSFTNRGQEYQDSYEALQKAAKKMGLSVNLPEQFDNGFRFDRVRTGEVVGGDDDGNQVLTFSDLVVFYKNDLGQQIHLYVHPTLDILPPMEEREPAASKTVGEITLNYYVDYYKFVPDGYEFSEEVQEWILQPGHYVSYGSDTMVEESFGFISWTTGDIDFSLTDRSDSLDSDVLFAMAEEIIG